MKCQFYFLSYVDDSLVLRMFLEKYFDLSFARLRWVFFQIFESKLCMSFFFGKIVSYGQHNFHQQTFKFLGGHGFRGFGTDLTVQS